MTGALHHLTFVVADIDQCERTLKALAPTATILREPLPGRDVDTVRARVGETWWVWVAPTRASAPMEHLARYGEGLMIVSLGVPSIEVALEDYARRGIGPHGVARDGLRGWRVQDLDLVLPGGVRLQLCEDPTGDGAGPGVP